MDSEGEEQLRTAGSPWGGKEEAALPWLRGNEEQSVYTHIVGTLDSRGLAALLQFHA